MTTAAHSTPTGPRVPIDQEVAQLIEAAAAELTTPSDAPPEQIRAEACRFNDWLRGTTDPTLATVPTRDEVIRMDIGPDVPIRWYGPPTTIDTDVVVFIHGGGWIAGSVDSYDIDVRLLHRLTGLTVVSVDYRRTPEHPFPAPLGDCIGAVRHVAAQSPRRLAVAGDSAGGNLALGAALAVRDERIVDAMLLIYPVVDPEAISNASYRDNGEGYLLTREAMVRYWDMYAGKDALRNHPWAAPARADLHGLPPTVVVSAGYDPLRDEDHELAAHLAAAGVEVTHLPNPGLTHGFQQMTPRIPAATHAVEQMYAAFTSALARTGPRMPLEEATALQRS